MKTWLFRPFERIAGGPALVLGLIVILLTAWMAARGGLHTDGVVDLHFWPDPGVLHLIAQGFINWLSLSLALLAAAWWLRRGRFRVLDLLATQALARWPLLLGVGYLSIRPISEAIEQGTANMMAAMPEDPSQVMAPPELLLEAMWLMLISLPLLALIGWMIWLMYHAYSLVTDLKGQRGIFSFAGALVVAEIFSKALIFILFQA